VGGVFRRCRGLGVGEMKRITMSWAAAREYKPLHPERTAYKEHRCFDFDVTFQTWPNRAAMLKTIELQGRREPRGDDWRACQ
jgi:hypothetical protein